MFNKMINIEIPKPCYFFFFSIVEDFIKMNISRFGSGSMKMTLHSEPNVNVNLDNISKRHIGKKNQMP